jgi:hypothetical protein
MSGSQSSGGYKYMTPQLGKLAQGGAQTMYNRLQQPMFSYEDFLKQMGSPTSFSDVPQDRYSAFSPELAARMRNQARAMPQQAGADAQLANERLRPGFGSNSPFQRAQSQNIGMLASAQSLQGLLGADRAIAEGNAQQGLQAQALQAQIESQRAAHMDRRGTVATQLMGTERQYYGDLARALAELTQPRQWNKTEQWAQTMQPYEPISPYSPGW